jgi:hypothetical protein
MLEGVQPPTSRRDVNALAALVEDEIRQAGAVVH